jgi:predicted unusual protein kinase regulating ubiquinone biosynthesis (AarF/ABC1/UbiB family)
MGGLENPKRRNPQSICPRSQVLRIITKFLDWLLILPPIDHLAQEYSIWIQEETDFVNEANNIRNANSKNDFVPIIPSLIPTNINLPELYGVHISSDGQNQLLRMEYIQGQTLNSIRQDTALDMESRREIINQCLRGFFSQFLIYGFVQADPHISNLIWNSKIQRLTFVDWGLAREFSSIQGLNLLRMFRGFLTGKRNLCFDGLFGLLKLTDEMFVTITPSLDIMFADISKMTLVDSNLPYRELGSRFLTTLLDILLKHKIKINTQSSSIFKAMACVYYSLSRLFNCQYA